MYFASTFSRYLFSNGILIFGQLGQVLGRLGGGDFAYTVSLVLAPWTDGS